MDTVQPITTPQVLRWLIMYAPSTYQISRLPDRKHMSSINHIGFISSLCTLNHCYQFLNGSTAKFPNASQEATFQVGFSKKYQSQVYCINSFVHSQDDKFRVIFNLGYILGQIHIYVYYNY